MKKPTCKICGRGLEKPESVSRGIGPECAQIASQRLASAGVCAADLGISEEIACTDQVARWLLMAELAALKGKKRDLEIFKAAAQRAADRERAARIDRMGIAA